MNLLDTANWIWALLTIVTIGALVWIAIPRKNDRDNHFERWYGDD